MQAQIARPTHASASRWRVSPRMVTLLGYAVLVGYSFIAVFPVILILVNSFKEKAAVFASPYSLPIPVSFAGYETVLSRANILRYFGNSLAVTLVTIFVVLFFGAMAAYALSEYRFRGNLFLNIYFALAIIIPIRLGTVSVIRLMQTLGVHGTVVALILIYSASGLPIAIYILGSFMRDVPRELKDSARIDGASEYLILFRIVLPLVRPALATVAVFHMIPVWNDLWWPLVLAPDDRTRTITLGVSWFVGQFKTDWSALLAALSLAMMPVLILYALFSRQLIRGLSEGAVKL